MPIDYDDVERTELVWPGKRTEVEKIELPFQCIETVNEGQAVRIVELYGAQQITGFHHLHGRKEGRMVHIGPSDAPVTAAEINEALAECQDAGQKALDVLGW